MKPFSTGKRAKALPEKPLPQQTQLRNKEQDAYAIH